MKRILEFVATCTFTPILYTLPVHVYLSRSRIFSQRCIRSVPLASFSYKLFLLEQNSSDENFCASMEWSQTHRVGRARSTASPQNTHNKEASPALRREIPRFAVDRLQKSHDGCSERRAPATLIKIQGRHSTAAQKTSAQHQVQKTSYISKRILRKQQAL